MTADEAHQLALNKIIQQIKESSEKGEFKLYLDDMSFVTERELKQLGYRIIRTKKERLSISIHW
jgi:hypothetical protein